jgi:hypothetical protein
LKVALNTITLTPVSYAVFVLYILTDAGQFGHFLFEKPEKTTHLLQVTDKLYHIRLYLVNLAWVGFELQTLVVIGTDSICVIYPHRCRTIWTFSLWSHRMIWSIITNWLFRYWKLLVNVTSNTLWGYREKNQCHRTCCDTSDKVCLDLHNCCSCTYMYIYIYCEHSNILQWILTKLGTYLDLKRIWNPIDFQGHRV